MVLYRDPNWKSNLYEVVKVQTCSGAGADVVAALNWEEVVS